MNSGTIPNFAEMSQAIYVNHNIGKMSSLSIKENLKKLHLYKQVWGILGSKSSLKSEHNTNTFVKPCLSVLLKLTENKIVDFGDMGRDFTEKHSLLG